MPQDIGPTIVDFEALAVTSGAAVSLTSTKVQAATNNVKRQYALITVEDNSVRWRADGTAPTTTVGHLAPAGTTIKLDSYAQLLNFKAIATAGAANLSVSYGF